MHESSNTSCVLLHCVTVVSRMLIQAEKGVWKRSRWELNPSHWFEPPPPFQFCLVVQLYSSLTSNICCSLISGRLREGVPMVPWSPTFG